MMKPSDMPAANIHSALAYAASGLPIFPVEARGKVPLVKDWPNRATHDKKTIRAWWEKWPQANIALHVGKASLAVLDIDPRNGGDVSLDKLINEHGRQWLSPIQVRTGGGGWHYYYAMPDRADVPAILARGIDLKRGNGYVLAPPSIHPNGTPYTFSKGGLLDGELDFAPRLPEWCTTPQSRNLIETDDWTACINTDPETPDNVARVQSALTKISADCERNEWRNVMFAIMSTGWDCAIQLARDWSMTAPQRFSEEGFRNIVDSAKTKPDGITLGTLFAMAAANGWDDPRTAWQADGEHLEDRTDTGNMNLMFRLSGGNLRWITERAIWLYWDGAQWHEDGAGVYAQSAASLVGDHYLQQAAEHFKMAGNHSLPTSEQNRIKKTAEGLKLWGHRCRAKGSIDNMLTMAKRDARFVISDADLNRNPHLLGVKNGVVDLRTGELKPDGRDDLVTRRCPTPYIPNAPAPIFRRLVREVTGTGKQEWVVRPDLERYLKKALGYFATASTKEHKMHAWIGHGANGKSLLLDTIQRVIGPYCVSISPELLMSAKNPDPEKATPMLMRLYGARLAVAVESKKLTDNLDVALIKRHTGGGYLSGRSNYSEGRQFEMTHKLVLMTNHLPNLDSLDDATRGRIHVIPFERQWNRPGVPNPDPDLPNADTTLFDSLKVEDAGILAYIVEGAVAYFDEGLEPPEMVKAHTLRYFATQDPLERFLMNFERCDPKAGTRASTLFEMFERWCRQECEMQTHSETSFGRSLKENRHRLGSRKVGGYVHYGLRATADLFEGDDDEL